MASFLGIKVVTGKERAAKVARVEDALTRLRVVLAELDQYSDEQLAERFDWVEYTEGVIADTRQWVSGLNLLLRLHRGQVFLWEKELAEAAEKVAARLGPLRESRAARDAVSTHESERARMPANARWSRLDPVKDWAFEQRRANPDGDRAPLIRRILPQVKDRAREAGEPLTGDDVAVTRTVTDWFRKAGIK